MNWAWASTLDQMWRSPTFPMWLTLAAAAFFAIIALITLLRAEKSVANGALTVITLLAVGVALAATTRGFGSINSGNADDRASAPLTASLPALACVDDIAGEAVLTACEKAVFGSPEATAAALSYAAHQITRLTAYGDVAAANKNLSPELEGLRRAVERDRYGLMAQVLVVRNRCTPSDCAAFKSLTDSRRVAANMDAATYDTQTARYAAIWNAPPPTGAAPPAAGFISGLPTGKPTNAEFPSASSTPPVSIMIAEPPPGSAPRTPPASTANAAPPPKPGPSASPTPAAAKKQAAPKAARTPTPTAGAPTPLAPAASND